MAIQKTTTQRGGTNLKDKEQPAPKRRGRPRKAPLADAPKANAGKAQSTPRAKKQIASENDADLTLGLQNAIEQADQEIANFNNEEFNRACQTNEDLYGVLAKLLAVHIEALNDPKGAAKFLKSRNVTTRKGANSAHGTVSAFFEEKDRTSLKERISQYSKAIHAMERNSVSPDDAVDWLGSTEPSEGSPVSKGLRKALNAYKKLEEVKNEAVKAAKRADRKAKQATKEAAAEISTQFEQGAVCSYATLRKQADRMEDAGKVVLLAGYVDEEGRVLLSELNVAEAKKVELIGSALNLVPTEEGE